MAHYIDTILNREGQPVPGAKIDIFTFPARVKVGTATSDALGMFAFDQPAGRYALEITGANFPSRVIEDVRLFDQVSGVPDSTAQDAGKVLTAGATPNAPGWQVLPTQAMTVFDPAESYAQNDLVAYMGTIYKALAAISPGAWDANQWLAVSGVQSPVTLFDPAADYASGDIVIQDGKLWAANGAITAGPWNPLQWKPPVFAVEVGVPLFSATDTYAVGQLVAKDGAIYKAITPIHVGVWNPSEWVEYATPFADQAEAHAGTNAAKALSPATLRGETIASPSATPANDADRIPRLNASGKIDSGFLPAAGAQVPPGVVLVDGSAGMTGNLTLPVQVGPSAVLPGGQQAISLDFAGEHFESRVSAGAGGKVTQATSKSTSVMLDKRSGEITLHNQHLPPAAMAGDRPARFLLLNNKINKDDIVVVSVKSGNTPGAYQVWSESVLSGSCAICIRNTSAASLAEAVVLQFSVITGRVD